MGELLIMGTCCHQSDLSVFQNICKKAYLRSKEEYIRNTLRSNIIEKSWLPIEIYIVNTGSIPTKPMQVTITVLGNIYGSSKVIKNTGKLYSPPTGAEKFRSDILIGAVSYLKSTEYEYLTVSNASPLAQELTYNLNDPIWQGKKNRYKLDTFYIDTSHPATIELKWQILEPTLGKNGNRGLLKISSHP